jgi:hypothetical protein
MAMSILKLDFRNISERSHRHKQPQGKKPTGTKQAVFGVPGR